ncbi:pdgfa associated protein 1a isoform X2 [Scleropages formosus]|uniref:pdgfa associated protein 1a isoform X2 n=1 Tax=Scleropages formosus TaxID=113540 RepID=UPI0008784180|nr:28 kDa heat- and acid-stable phosphoprotein-like isoform X2 [Scleropages formosus]
MPRSGKKGYKGRRKQFSNPEEIDRQMRAEKEKEDDADSDPESTSESEESSDDEQRRKGVEGLIEIENPNRITQNSKKVTDLDVSVPKELSRREREEIEKQRAKDHYMKLHLEGKTEQAQADLARLAIIKKQREEAARKREELRKEKEEAAKYKR